MLMTRETDYALRIIRSLVHGELMTVGDICRKELIPQQFAYKILKKLAKAGLVTVTRGVDGGCRLTADLNQTTLYDLMSALENQSHITACTQSGYVCEWQSENGKCSIHCTLAQIQRRLDEELRSYSLRELILGKETTDMT